MHVPPLAQVSQESRMNLDALRLQLVRHLALLITVASMIGLWWSLPQEPFSPSVCGLWLVLMGLGLFVHRFAEAHTTLVRYALIIGIGAGCVAAMALFDAPWLPFWGIALVVISTLLMPAGGAMMGVCLFGAAVVLAHTGVRAYPLLNLAASFAFSAVLAWIATHTLYTALEWAWTMQQRADQLLNEARAQRAELSSTLKSLNVTLNILDRTKQDLVFARVQADEARQMKEQFAANISHELRTPLNLILGFSELMYRSPDVYGEMIWPPELCRDVYQIYRSSRHLLALIDDILDLSRFEIAGFTLHKEPVSLTALLHDTAAIARDLFRGRAVTLEVDTASNLPTLELDSTRIRQVVLNLLNNACRFTEYGTVRLAAWCETQRVVVSVRDTGPGIPTDKLSHIFDEFYQVDQSLRRNHGGAGLGLAISKRFVQAHGGNIWAESEEGAGATFFFTLPLHEHLARPASPSSETAGQVLPQSERQTILVVDTDPAVAAFVRRHLDTYDIVQIEDGSYIADAVAQHHPRAIIHNITPGAHAHALDVPVNVPCIVCSLPSVSWMVQDLAVAACLTKPLTAGQLLHELERLGDVHDILIIDDDRGFIQLIMRMIAAAGGAYHVRRAYDGADGLAAMHAQKPDAVLLDLMMPNVDGFQVREAMRHDPELADVPVILLTATSYTEDVLSRNRSEFIVRRPDGLQPGDVLRCLHAVIDVLEPHYDERVVPQYSKIVRW